MTYFRSTHGPQIERTTIAPKDLLSRYAAGERDFARISIIVQDTEKRPLNRASLAGANLSEAELFVDFDDAVLDACDLTNASLLASHSTFWGDCVGSLRPSLQRTKFRGTRMNGANLGGTVCRDADFSGANMSDVNLRGSDLSRARFIDVQLERAVFTRAIIDQTDFRGARLRGTTFGTSSKERRIGVTNISGAQFQGADLQGATFRGVRLHRCDLTDANLTDADFTDAKLVACVIDGARLDGALFSHTTLQRIDLCSTSLAGCSHERRSVVSVSTLATTGSRARHLSGEQRQTIRRFLSACGVPEAAFPWGVMPDERMTVVLSTARPENLRGRLALVVDDVLLSHDGCRVASIVPRSSSLVLRLEGRTTEQLEAVAAEVTRRFEME